MESAITTYSAISMIGKREINEDSLAIGRNANISFFIVADGLGGHDKGELASQLVVKTMKQVMSTSDIQQPDRLIDDAILKAQKELMEEQTRHRILNQMKTTVVVLCICEDVLCWGHVGDSRLYAFKKNKVVERTLDHSIPQMLVISKEIPERKIRTHPQRNMLLRVMGVGWENPRHEISEKKAATDYQAFLLCSDGFWELITEKQMEHLLKKSKNVEEWLRRMTQIVEESGRKKDMDNYTAIAIWLTPGK